MRYTRHLTASLAVVTLAGCGTAPNPATTYRLQDVERTRPTCSTPDECQQKWEVAQLWVVKNADYKIQTATSVLIQTFNPRRSSSAIAAQVTKEPLGGGRYRFVAKVWCDNMFGCKPDEVSAVLDFNGTVNAVKP